MPKRITIGFVVCLLIGCASLESQVTPEFEVASFKISDRGSGLTDISPPGVGRFSATNVSLEFLITVAYDVTDYQISGQPSWFGNTVYDVVAKPPGDMKLSREELRPMLQRLLAQRLKLVTHRERKDFPGYALVVAKGGPKLQKSAGKAGQVFITRDQLQAPNVTLRVLAFLLTRPLHRPVEDKTGLEGNFDLRLEYAPEGVEPVDTSRPSVFAAVQEQLGLKLESAKVPLEMLVIDHVERVPADN